MPAKAPPLLGSLPHDMPRRLGLLDHATLAPAAQAAAPHGAGGGGHSEPFLEDASSEDQWGLPDELDGGVEVGAQEGQDEEVEEEEDDDDYDDDDDDDDSGEYDYEDEDQDDEDSLNHPGHFNCPIHHMPYQASYYEDMEAYLSDNLGMSEDAGAPLVEDVIAHLLSDDVDMTGAPEALEDHGGFSWAAAEDAASVAESDITPNPEVAAAAQAAVMEAHVQAAAFVGSGTQPAAALFDPPIAPGAVWTHAFSFSNPNPATIGPSNLGLTDFLHHWARQSRILQSMARGSCPWPSSVNALQDFEDDAVEFDDLEGDQFDLQGVDWEDLGVTRRDARERRLLTYTNYVNIPGSDRWTPNLPDVALPRKDSFFRYRRMGIKRNIHLSHFQLRHVFASTSRSRVFYPAVGSVQQFNPVSGHGRSVLKLSDAPASQVSTLAAGHGVLVAGGFGGEYILRHLDSGEPENTACHEGVITSSISGITNHVAVHQSRTSSAPVAAFASNDNCFRIMDITTEAWLSQETHGFAPNCTAVSPDGRLRVMVGDSLDVVITAAESRLPSGKPDILQKLSGHRDYGFACDWADDGWTIATAFQDKTVKIWDARRFTDSSGNGVSVCTMRSEMAGVRSLRFSPIGSGKRVLVAAEEADFINIIDAQTFRSKQTVDVFGELGGISFENGGQNLMVLCCDRTRGGIIQLERCGAGDELAWSSDEEEFSYGEDDHRRWALTPDWARSMFTEAKRARGSSSRRRRKAGVNVDMDPF